MEVFETLLPKRNIWGAANLSASNRKYSVEKEIEYYKDSKRDRRAIPYTRLTKYINGSVGNEFFVGKEVLDLGSGEGQYSAWIADNGRAKKVYGVELTEHRIRRDYEDNLRNLKLLNGNIFMLDALDLPQYFDIVFMNLVLHHLRFDLVTVANVVSDKLRKGGRFLAFEPNVYSPLATLSHLYNDRSENEGFLTPIRIRKTFISAGFKECEIGFFWRDRKWAKNPFLASSFYFIAKK